MLRYFTIVFLLLSVINSTTAQNYDELKKGIEQLSKEDDNLNHRLDQLAKMIDDVLW